MSFQQKHYETTVPASGDLSANQFLFHKVDANGQLALAGAGEMALGVLQNKPAAQGRAADVAVLGITKVKAGGTVAAGAKITPDAAGKAVAVSAAATQNVVGIAMNSGVNGDIIPVLLILGGLST